MGSKNDRDQPSTFAAWLAKAVDGDRGVWREMFDEYAPAIAGYARVQGVGDVEDIVSETFLAVFRAIEHFQGGRSQFRSWLFVIAHHKIVDDRRRDSRVVTHQLAGSDTSTSGDDAATLALDRMGAEQVIRLCGDLSADQRDVLLLRTVADLTIEEIGSLLGKSPGAVKALQRRGLGALDGILRNEAVPL